MDLPNELKQKLFEDYFLPLISNPEKLSNEKISWFREKSRTARILNFNQIDFKKIDTVYNICMDLSNEKTLIQTFLKSYFGRYSIENEKIEQTQFEDEDKKNASIFAQKLNNTYKSYFETGLRFYHSIFYLYAKVQEGNTHNIDDLLNISASTKFHYIKDHLINTKKYNIAPFLDGFDNNLRNQGGGHEQYFVDDNSNIVYTKSDNKTGEEKRVYSMSFQELEQFLKDIYRNFVIIDIAIAIYLVNSGMTVEGGRDRPFLQREIDGRIKKHAINYGMDVTMNFLDNGDIEMTVRKHKQDMINSEHIGEMISAYYHYYLVPMKITVTRKEQLCWLIYNVGKFFPKDNMQNQLLHIEIKENTEPVTISINKNEIMQMIELGEKDQKYMPILDKGSFPEGGFELRYNERIEDDGSFTREQLEDAYRRTFGKIK